MFRGGKTATIVATGGHFQSVVGFASRKKAIAGSSKMQLEIFSVHSPIEELVRELNQFDPGILMGYGSVVSILANEQAAGRLSIKPLLIIPAGEGLSKEEKSRISDTFQASVHDFYGSTECTFLSAACSHGWYHVNSEWAIAEPVDTDNNPVEPGVQSHSVLITNLANHLQPVIRYDLGDSVVVRPDACPCGNPHPALQVKGRSADVLEFHDIEEKTVSVLPLALATLIDGVTGITMYQLEQSSPSSIHVRLECNPGENQDEIWKTVKNKLTDYLTANGLGNVSVELRNEAPKQGAGGKIRRIVAYK